VHWVYILQGEKTGRHYIGSTEDVEERVRRHNRGANRSTKSGVPWVLVYKEEFSTKKDAYRKEMKIKSYKGGEAFKKLLKFS